MDMRALMKRQYNVELRIERNGESHIEHGIVGDGIISMPVDADIQERDRISRQLPNGRIQSFIAAKVSVLQSPFGFPDLDHTEVHVIGEKEIRLPGGPQNYIKARNVQYIQGDSNVATMTVGLSGNEASLLIDCIVKVLEQNDASLDAEDIALVKGAKLVIEDSPSCNLPKRVADVLQHAIEKLSDEGIKFGLGVLLQALISS